MQKYVYSCFNSLLLGFIDTFWHSRPFKDVHDLDAAQNKNEFDTPVLEKTTPNMQPELLEEWTENKCPQSLYALRYRATKLGRLYLYTLGA